MKTRTIKGIIRKYFHLTFSVSNGSKPIGLGLRFYLWRQPYALWQGSVDILFLIWDLQFGFHQVSDNWIAQRTER